MCFRCYGNLKFPLTYNEKSESRCLLLSCSRYFDRTFLKMLSSPPPSIKKLYKFLIISLVYEVYRRYIHVVFVFSVTMYVCLCVCVFVCMCVCVNIFFLSKISQELLNLGF